MPKSATRTAKPFLTGVLDKIIKEAIYPYHLLTAKQITRLLYPTEKLGMFTTIKDRLKQLTDAKYLTAGHLPTASGQRPFVYCLAQMSSKYLRDEGYEPTIYFEKEQLERRSPGWYYHLLELNDFLISASTLERSQPALSLYDMLHDFTIAKNPPASLKKDGKLAQVTPDGFLDFRLARSTGGQEKTRRYCFLVELDRGTESDQKFSKKIRDYLILLEQETVQTHFGAKQLTIIFPTTALARRVEKMRDIARAELKAVDKSISETSYRNQMFKFAHIPPFMQSSLDPMTLFTTPFWTSPYGQPEQKATLIDLTK